MPSFVVQPVRPMETTGRTRRRRASSAAPTRPALPQAVRALEVAEVLVIDDRVALPVGALLLDPFDHFLLFRQRTYRPELQDLQIPSLLPVQHESLLKRSVIAVLQHDPCSEGHNEYRNSDADKRTAPRRCERRPDSRGHAAEQYRLGRVEQVVGGRRGSMARWRASLP